MGPWVLTVAWVTETLTSSQNCSYLHINKSTIKRWKINNGRGKLHLIIIQYNNKQCVGYWCTSSKLCIILTVPEGALEIQYFGKPFLGIQFVWSMTGKREENRLRNISILRFWPKNYLNLGGGGGLWNVQCVVCLPCRCYIHVTKRWSHEPWNLPLIVDFRNKLVTTRKKCLKSFFLHRLKFFAHVQHQAYQWRPKTSKYTNCNLQQL